MSLALMQGPDAVGIVALLSIFIGFPIAIGVARYFWRRAAEPARQDLGQDHARRLAQMQQAIDAIAIEVERISEGQRFITKVLGDKEQARALPEGEKKS